MVTESTKKVRSEINNRHIQFKLVTKSQNSIAEQIKNRGVNMVEDITCSHLLLKSNST